MLNGQNFFDEPAYDTRTYDNILKVATDKGNNYTACFRLDYPCFKQGCKLIVIDLGT